jgi:hypothetical protein
MATRKNFPNRSEERRQRAVGRTEQIFETNSAARKTDTTGLPVSDVLPKVRDYPDREANDPQRNLHGRFMERFMQVGRAVDHAFTRVGIVIYSCFVALIVIVALPYLWGLVELSFYAFFLAWFICGVIAIPFLLIGSAWRRAKNGVTSVPPIEPNP